jgi:ELWxxDGT repeat protein
VTEVTDETCGLLYGSFTSYELAAMAGSLYAWETNESSRRGGWHFRATRNLDPMHELGLVPRDTADMVVFEGALFLGATRSVDIGSELYRVTGRAGETHLVRDIAPYERSSSPHDLRVRHGLLCFLANDGHGVRHWVSDGTRAGTRPGICPA